MRTTTPWTLLATGLLTAACAGDGNVEPGEIFRLTEVGGRPLPVTYPEEQGCTEEIRSATLELEADGEWEMTMSKREICGDAVEEGEGRPPEVLSRAVRMVPCRIERRRSE